MQDLIEGMALRKPPPRVAEVYRAVGSIAGDRRWRAPCNTVVRRIIVRLDPGLLALAHHGPDVYRDRYELVLRRDCRRGEGPVVSLIATNVLAHIPERQDTGMEKELAELYVKG